jgi:hypothetical protein
MKTYEPSSKEKRDAQDYRAGVKEEIRHRAYQIWEQRGKRGDGALEDWLRAEAEIMTHRVMGGAA